jgi:dTDP-4-amino-4,6-dideoxygalactose transaminase
LLLEDCAQAHSAKSNGTVAGSFSVAGAYSFYPTKNLGTLGDGGMIVTGSQEVAERAMRLRNYGQSTRYSHPVLGLNSRLDEIHAAMLSERMKWLDVFTRRRQQVANRYIAQISNPAVSCLAPAEEQDSHVYHLFVVTCAKRDALQRYLSDRAIQTLIHYPIPVHFQEPCRNISRDPLGLTVSEQHAATCLSIPCHPQMSEDEVATVIDAINSFRAN